MGRGCVDFRGDAAYYDYVDSGVWYWDSGWTREAIPEAGCSAVSTASPLSVQTHGYPQECVDIVAWGGW